MAYLLVNYDFKFDGDGLRPENQYRGYNITPDLSKRMLFKQRKTPNSH